MHVSSTRFPQRLTAALIAVAFTVAGVLQAGEKPPLLFRIFLTDGSHLVSYGEFARVAGRVVLSVPIGDIERRPRLQIVGIPEAAVDWVRTDEYADAVRARHYAETRGEEEFAVLTGHVTVALNDIMGEPNPQRRLAMAQEARRNLAAWPEANYGYKAEDVAKLVALFDDAITELRAAAGDRSIDLSLVATTLPPPRPALLPPPDVRGTFDLAYNAALRTSDAGERTALLASLANDLRHAPANDPWAVALRRDIQSRLAQEARIDRSYADLSSTLVTAANTRVQQADVRGLQDIIARALRADASLGRHRPREMAALLATLDLRLNDARRLRLARDAWILRQQAIAEYHDAIRAPMERLASFRKWLESIRMLDGPDPRFLRPLEDRSRVARLELVAVTPPPEAQAAHSLMVSALDMTRHAAMLRRTAISSGDMKVAWDASAAAAGAISLSDEAFDQFQRLLSSEPR